jgi:hypothetical protein
MRSTGSFGFPKNLNSPGLVFSIDEDGHSEWLGTR